MKMCDCVQGRLPCTCQPHPSAAQSVPLNYGALDPQQRLDVARGGILLEGDLSGVTLNGEPLEPRPIAAQSAPDEREAVELALLREYRLSAIAFSNSHGVETDRPEEAVEIERKAEARLEAAEKACWDFYGNRGAAWQRAQSAPVVPEGWRVFLSTSDGLRDGDRWEVYGPSGGGIVSTHDVKDWAVRGLLDALAAAPQPAASADCEAHTVISAPCCPVCLLEERDELRQKVQELNERLPCACEGIYCVRAARQEQGDEVRRLREALEKLERRYADHAKLPCPDWVAASSVAKDIRMELSAIDAALSASADGK